MQSVPLFFPFFFFVFWIIKLLSGHFLPSWYHSEIWKLALFFFYFFFLELLIKCLVSCHFTGAGQGILLRESTASAYTDIRGVGLSYGGR